MKRYLYGIMVPFIIGALSLYGCKAKPKEAPVVEMPAAEETLDFTLPARSSGEEPVSAVKTADLNETTAFEETFDNSTVSSSQSAEVSSVPTPQEIQKALKNAGLYTGAIDGVIGPKTKEAIKQFQKDNNLTVDGVVGKQSWSRLKKYLD